MLEEKTEEQCHLKVKKVLQKYIKVWEYREMHPM